MCVWISTLSGYPGIFLTPSELRERFGSIAQVKTSISGRELEIYLIQSTLENEDQIWHQSLETPCQQSVGGQDFASSFDGFHPLAIRKFLPSHGPAQNAQFWDSRKGYKQRARV